MSVFYTTVLAQAAPSHPPHQGQERATGYIFITEIYKLLKLAVITKTEYKIAASHRDHHTKDYPRMILL